jgi:hypothetical protein
VSPWTVQSAGRAEAVAVEGDALGAVAALGVRHARTAAVTPAEAMARMTWAGASGGAHGRRRGTAAGRSGAWWTLAALAGLDEEWPLDATDAAQAAHGLRWFAWDAREPEMGWHLRLAVDDPDAGLAWAVAAVVQG